MSTTLYSDALQNCKAIRQVNCILPHRDDGVWDKAMNKWKIHPCRRKQCPKHWKRYARKQFHKLKLHLNPRLLTYHLRIHTNIKHTKATRTDYLGYFLKLLFQTQAIESCIWIKHNGIKGVHYHIILQSILPLEKHPILEAWRKSRPCKRLVPWHEKTVWLRERENPYAPLWYALGLSYKHPRTYPPWYKTNGHVARKYQPRNTK